MTNVVENLGPGLRQVKQGGGGRLHEKNWGMFINRTLFDVLRDGTTW
jgi:hypothetical protein